jgi:ferrous iron transport protein B
MQPVFAPLGYDRQLTIGVLTSFAAREVFVSTMAVVVAGEEDSEKEGVLEEIAAAKRDDGSPVFTAAVGWSLLVYYVLAMQCLPTLAGDGARGGRVEVGAFATGVDERAGVRCGDDRVPGAQVKTRCSARLPCWGCRCRWGTGSSGR